jgi:hypothetical protein
VSGGRVDAAAAVVRAREQAFFPNGLHIRLRSVTNGKYATPSDAAGSQLFANGETAGKSQTFEVVELGGSLYALRSLHNGRYVTAEAGGEKALSATRDVVSEWEMFYPVQLGNGHFALRSKANGLLVTAEREATGALIANREVIGEWETFIVETLHLLPVGKKIALQNTASGRFVALDSEGALVPMDATAGPRNAFDVGISLDGYPTLRSVANGSLVTARTEGTLPLRANAQTVGDWEKFVGEAYRPGIIAIRCKANGRYVGSDQVGTGPLVANREVVAGWELYVVHVLE